ncbi:hypothetical protein Q9295_10630 [Xinfangfangia sp. CPCC 101601]|uniref:Uncharacterized protein n=1 Tax=Pseudogemmobacter lacusdianii TaxID=3069608 RepID=A0ABU0VYK3_9RHOB|nr:hypothetical protein [Xinfangfangia sp. CPCC 101601]MDQ2066832.1 hypothetical protein [Xinfangfangia sp. CPCC 101601]
MTKMLASAFAVLTLTALPALAFSVDTTLPRLTWPADGVTVSTQGPATKTAP